MREKILRNRSEVMVTQIKRERATDLRRNGEKKGGRGGVCINNKDQDLTEREREIELNARRAMEILFILLLRGSMATVWSSDGFTPNLLY